MVLFSINTPAQLSSLKVSFSHWKNLTKLIWSYHPSIKEMFNWEIKKRLCRSDVKDIEYMLNWWHQRQLVPEAYSDAITDEASYWDLQFECDGISPMPSSKCNIFIKKETVVKLVLRISPKIHIPDPCRTTHVAEDIDGMPLYALSLILCFNSQPLKTCIWQNIFSHITATDYWRKRERLFPDQLFNGRLLPQLSSNHCHKRTDSTYKTFHNCQTCSGFKIEFNIHVEKFDIGIYQWKVIFEF